MQLTVSRRLFSFLLALTMVVSLFAGMTITASAANLIGTPTGYTKATDVQYDTSGTYLKNWGARGEACTFLTTYAQNYYTGSYSYETLAANAGGTSQSDATSSALYTALQNMLTAKHTTHTGYQATRPMYCYTDCVNSNISYISSFYSSTQVTGSWDSGSTWNREHVWPHSKDADTNTNTDSNDSQDIVMLRPTAVSENSSRGNTAYGESSGYFDPNTVSTAVNVRGDCARILLFIYTEYGTSSNDIWSNMWGTSGVIESKDVLLNWMREDPVDTWEMGRNDVVQDITGVRNVFVDYPELAFQLFGESVPAGYTTPSGGSAASSYTVTATSNNTAWGTVSVSGNTITATPASGYYAEGYTVTSGTASVTQNGNVFTVNPSSDCTVRINFAAKQQVTVTYMANGSTYSTATVYAGDAITLPATATAVEGWTVTGWSSAAIAETTAKPEYYALGASFVPTANATLYAVYTKSEAGSGEGGDYVLIDSTEDLVLGQYLIVYTSGSLAFNGGLDKLDASGNYISVTISDDKIASTAATDAAAFTIDPDAGTIQSASGYYIGATSNTSNTLLSSQTTVYTNVIDFTGDNADITSQGGAILRYNTGGRFRYYKSSTYTSQQAIQLYLKSSGETVTYTTAPTGVDYTLTFTVPIGVTAVAPMTVNSVVGATLPTAEAPEGYTFLGWVLEDYDYVTVRPDDILTGVYKPVDDVTLKALYTKHDVTGPTLNQMAITDTFADGDKVVIVESGGQYGLYQKTALIGKYVDNFEFTNNASDILADELKYFNVTQTDGGWYLGDATNGWLYNSSLEYMTINKDSSYMTTWILTTYNGHLALKRTYDYNDSVYYVRCETASSGTPQNKWNVVRNPIDPVSGIITLNIYKLDEGGDPVDYYTTIIHAEHEHTPAAPVQENVVPATCTAAGSYDSVVYCSECGEEISRETVTVPALGHTPGEAVKENEVAATCTAAGGYDMVVYCTVCNAELSREHTETPATGHTPGEAVKENEVAATCTAAGGYDMVVYCTVCNEELSREHTELPATGHSWGEWISNNDGTHTRTCAACGEAETHNCEFGNDTVCDVCGYEKKLQFIGSLALENATAFIYTVKASEVEAFGLDSFHLVVVHTAYDKATNTYNDETVILDGTKSGSNYNFVFEDIPAMALNDRMVAHLEGEKNGETWSSNAVNYNAIDYCYRITTQTSKPESLRRTCANLILFAESAQKAFNYNTANLPTKNWTDEQENLCDRTVPTWTTGYYSELLEGATVKFSTLMLDVNSRIDLKFVIIPGSLNAEDLTAEICYEGLKGVSKSFTIPGSDWEDYGTQGRKAVTLHQMNAGEMQSSVAIVIKDANGNAVSSTVHYSVDDYAGILYNNPKTSDEMKNLMVTMINYSLRAKDYLENK